MARKRPNLDFSDLRNDYDELKREIIDVLKWPDVKAEFKRFEQENTSQHKHHAGVIVDPSKKGGDLGGRD